MGEPRLSAERLAELERDAERTRIGRGPASWSDVADLVHDLRVERERAERLEQRVKELLPPGVYTDSREIVRVAERFLAKYYEAVRGDINKGLWVYAEELRRALSAASTRGEQT